MKKLYPNLSLIIRFPCHNVHLSSLESESVVSNA